MTETSWGWSDKLRVRFEPMNEIHREFALLCAELAQSGPDELPARLDALIAHCVAHFEMEDQWMTEHDFAAGGCHIQEHRTVLELMREVQSRVAAGETSLGLRLAEELPHWFEQHVDTMDNMLAHFMAQRYTVVPA